jgi:hypothetical protein
VPIFPGKFRMSDGAMLSSSPIGKISILIFRPEYSPKHVGFFENYLALLHLGLRI